LNEQADAPRLGIADHVIDARTDAGIREMAMGINVGFHFFRT
jgi:hypothetical protein